MDLSKNGQLLCSLRKSKGLTQKQVADILGVVPKTVSKWETGHGFPDISAVSALADILGVSSETILSGSLDENTEDAGNMKRTKFYVCEKCGNILTGLGNADISCCGRKLRPLTARKCDDAHKLKAEKMEDEYYITFSHPMEKEHYISFVAYVRFDRALIVKLYPEQGGELRIPQMRGGKIYCCCSRHGLFEAEI